MPLTPPKLLEMVGRSFIEIEKRQDGRRCLFFQYCNHGCVREIRHARVPVSAKGISPWLPRKKRRPFVPLPRLWFYGFTESGHPDGGESNRVGETSDEVVYRVPQLVEK